MVTATATIRRQRSEDLSDRDEEMDLDGYIEEADDSAYTFKGHSGKLGANSATVTLGNDLRYTMKTILPQQINTNPKIGLQQVI
ncbi:angio-associated migratory cell protein isoform X1 [Canna indica]|uniref:Angio-associated migratory cell protein isoform X1 n=1 Tax=Canna indica TaxID=4628 RepID=A0AAQ3QKQ2_9LILI|nr:angio-associated migratory cell protein isoform X1 [Canna indica]